MPHLSRRKTRTLLPCLVAGTVLLSGCMEWDNTDDESSQSTSEVSDESGGNTGEDSGSGNDAGSNDGSNGDGDTIADTETPSVSGVAATTEPLSDAEVCVDQNANGDCDDGEPSSRTDSQGRFVIALPDGPLSGPTQIVTRATETTTLANSGSSVNINLSLMTTAIPNMFDPTIVGDLFISPISTLVEAEQNRLPSGDRDEAIANIAGKMDTTTDILANYLNPPAESNPAEEAEYERLSRIAEVTFDLAQEMDSGISDSERETLGQTETDQRIYEKINDDLDTITDDVNASLVTQPEPNDFDSQVIVSAPEYQELNQPPSTDEPTASLSELESRIANAESRSPFFEEVGFETYPVQGAELFDLTFFENTLIPTLNERRITLHEKQVELAELEFRTPPPAPTLREEEQVYYEARRRVTVNTEQDAAIADIQIRVPRNDDPQADTTTPQTIDESICENEDFACDELTATVTQVRALSWTGYALRERTIQTGHSGRQRYFTLNDLGDIIANSESTQFTSRLNFREFSLAGLEGVEVADELIGGNNLPNLGSFTFNTDSRGYSVSEILGSQLLLSAWPEGGTGNLCDSPGLPDASVTQSCNLVYGAVGQSTGMPAETFAQALYPVSEQDNAYTSLLENGEPVDALPISGPDDQLYLARLFGSDSNDQGVIRLYRQQENGSFETLSLAGQWQKQGVPYPRIDLNLPSGFDYADAQIGFDLGNAYLYERGGFLRHGWRIPNSVNVDTLYGRRQVQYAFNDAAYGQIINQLDNLGIVTEHPYYTRLLIEELDTQIAETQAQIDDARSPVGSGGNTE